MEKWQNLSFNYHQIPSLSVPLSVIILFQHFPKPFCFTVAFGLCVIPEINAVHNINVSWSMTLHYLFLFNRNLYRKKVRPYDIPNGLIWIAWPGWASSRRLTGCLTLFCSWCCLWRTGVALQLYNEINTAHLHLCLSQIITEKLINV